MMLWIILTALCSAAAVLVAIPLIRRYEQPAGPLKADVAFYRDQLREIDRDRAAGTIAAGEADLAAVEIQRRLLAVARASETSNPISPLWRRAALVGVAGFVSIGGTAIYSYNGRPDLASPRSQMASTASENLPSAGAGDVDGKIAVLAARMRQNPGDAEGWRMLGWSYFNTQHYDEAAGAYAKAVALQPENNEFQSAYAEAMVQAAGGQVIPVSLGIFEAVTKRDPKEFRSRFYIALAREQAGDVNRALDLWMSLLTDAPPDAGWLVDVKARIADLAQKTGRKVSGINAGQPVPKPGGLTDASAGQDQKAAIAAMMAKLSAKLDASPVDRDGWVMMIRSLTVIGDKPGAGLALEKARIIFANDPSTRTQIEAIALSLGVTAEPAGGPSASDMAAVAALPEQDQQVMIRGMVDGLAERLAASPHDAEGWIRLIRSRMVLNEPDLARDALKKAMAEFSNDVDVSNRIAETARSLGLVVN